MIYPTLHLDNAGDAIARVQFRDADSLTARIGGSASNAWTLDQAPQPRLLIAWLVANIWHEFNANSITAFSSDDGSVPFHSDMTGTWWEIGTGLSAQLSHGAFIYATLANDKGFNGGVKAFNGNVGFKFHW